MRPSFSDHRGAALWRWLTIAMCVPLFYIASIGPMTRILSGRGERAYRIWQVAYGEPLGKLPRPLRAPINWYIRLCDGIE